MTEQNGVPSGVPVKNDTVGIVAFIALIMCVLIIVVTIVVTHSTKVEYDKGYKKGHDAGIAEQKSLNQTVLATPLYKIGDLMLPNKKDNASNTDYHYYGQIIKIDNHFADRIYVIQWQWQEDIHESDFITYYGDRIIDENDENLDPYLITPYQFTTTWGKGVNKKEEK